MTKIIDSPFTSGCCDPPVPITLALLAKHNAVHHSKAQVTGRWGNYTHKYAPPSRPELLQKMRECAHRMGWPAPLKEN